MNDSMVWLSGKASSSWVLRAGAVLLSLYSVGCADVEAMLDDEMEKADVIFHGGCNEQAKCGFPRRQCGAELGEVLEYYQENGVVAIEWEAPSEPFRLSPTFYWFIDDSDARKYWTSSSGDTIPCDDCGWRLDECRWPIS